TTGSVVGLNYDPMLAKLIVHAPTRELAIARMERALRELVIHGVETSREFHLRMMADEDYRTSNVTIQWLESKLPEILARQPSAETTRVAVIAAALFAQQDRGGRPGTGVAAVAAGGSGSSGAAGATAELGVIDASRASWAAQARREALRGS